MGCVGRRGSSDENVFLAGGGDVAIEIKKRKMKHDQFALGKCRFMLSKRGSSGSIDSSVGSSVGSGADDYMKASPAKHARLSRWGGGWSSVNVKKKKLNSIVRTTYYTTLHTDKNERMNSYLSSLLLSRYV